MNLKLYYNCLGPVGTTAIAEALHAPQPHNPVTIPGGQEPPVQGKAYAQFLSAVPLHSFPLL